MLSEHQPGMCGLHGTDRYFYLEETLGLLPYWPRISTSSWRRSSGANLNPEQLQLAQAA
jgi:hypothetical protein